LFYSVDLTFRRGDVRKQVLLRSLVRNLVDLLCEQGVDGSDAPKAPVPERAVLSRGKAIAVPPEVRGAFDGWRAGGGAGVSNSVLLESFAICRWRRVVLHPEAWVELDGGAVGQVRQIFRGSDAGGDGGALLLVELMRSTSCADLYAHIPGSPSCGRKGAMLDDFGFSVLRNRYKLGPPLDLNAAELVVVGVAALRCVRHVTKVHGRDHVLRLGEGRWGLSSGWLCQKP
jgi:hypothetical protein